LLELSRSYVLANRYRNNIFSILKIYTKIPDGVTRFMMDVYLTVICFATDVLLLKNAVWILVKEADQWLKMLKEAIDCN
jgi:hypothetical protein